MKLLETFVIQIIVFVSSFYRKKNGKYFLPMFGVYIGKIISEMHLNKLNQSAFHTGLKPIIKLKGLPIDTKYAFFSGKVIVSKSEECIFLELETNCCFSPKRVTETFRTELKYFKTKTYAVVFKILQGTSKFQPAAKFISTEN